MIWYKPDMLQSAMMWHDMIWYNTIYNRLWCDIVCFSVGFFYPSNRPKPFTQFPFSASPDSGLCGRWWEGLAGYVLVTENSCWNHEFAGVILVFLFVSRSYINKVEVAIEKLILNINLVHLLDEMVEDFIYWEAIRYHCWWFFDGLHKWKSVFPECVAKGSRL